MANSLRAKLSKLRHDGNITNAEYEALVKKLGGHDKELRNDVIDEFVKEMKGNAGGGLITSWNRPYGISYERIEELAEQMKGVNKGEVITETTTD